MAADLEIHGAACPTWAFGRKFEKGVSCSASAEDGIGRFLGVWGAAFCANTERISSENLWPSQLPVEKALRSLLGKPRGDDMVCSPPEFHDHRAQLSTEIPTGSVVGLADAGVGFNIPLPPVLQPERAVDVVIAFDYIEYRSGKGPGAPNSEWVRGIKYCEAHGLPFPPMDPDQLLREPVSVFHGTRGEPTLIVFHLFKVATDPEGLLDPQANAAAFGFCSTLSAKFTGDQFDMLASFNRARLLDGMDIVKGAIAAKLRSKRAAKGSA